MNKQSRAWLGAGLATLVLGGAGFGLATKLRPAHAEGGGGMPPAKVAIAAARKTQVAIRKPRCAQGSAKVCRRYRGSTTLISGVSR